jgi:hypothetical protein
MQCISTPPTTSTRGLGGGGLFRTIDLPTPLSCSFTFLNCARNPSSGNALICFLFRDETRALDSSSSGRGSPLAILFHSIPQPLHPLGGLHCSNSKIEVRKYYGSLAAERRISYGVAKNWRLVIWLHILVGERMEFLCSFAFRYPMSDIMHLLSVYECHFPQYRARLPGHIKS